MAPQHVCKTTTGNHRYGLSFTVSCLMPCAKLKVAFYCRFPRLLLRNKLRMDVGGRWYMMGVIGKGGEE